MFHLSCVTQPDFLPPEPRLGLRPVGIMSSLSLSFRSALWLIANPRGEFTSDRLWRCQVQVGSGCRLLAASTPLWWKQTPSLIDSSAERAAAMARLRSRPEQHRFSCSRWAAAVIYVNTVAREKRTSSSQKALARTLRRSWERCLCTHDKQQVPPSRESSRRRCLIKISASLRSGASVLNATPMEQLNSWTWGWVTLKIPELHTRLPEWVAGSFNSLTVT